MDGFCNQNADQLGSLAGLSFPAVYVGVVECARPYLRLFIVGAAAANVAKLIRRRRISLKRDNHPKPIPLQPTLQPFCLPG